jgi:hypothetical protein
LREPERERNAEKPDGERGRRHSESDDAGAHGLIGPLLDVAV